jgi:hypothetical protein
MWLVINILCIGIGIGIVFWAKKKETIVALIATFFGIFISVCDEYFGQYDNDPSKIVSSIWKETFNCRDFDVSEIVKKDDKTLSNIFFVLDVSGSMKKEVKIDDETKIQLNKKIGGINNHGAKKIFNEITTNDIPISNLLCIHLCSILRNMQNSNYSNYRFYIIQFAKNPEYLEGPNSKMKYDFSESDILTVFKMIDTIKFNKDETDFVNLFEFFNDKIKADYNNFSRNKNTLVFLSDFIHDSKDNKDRSTTEYDINSTIEDLLDKDIHLNIIGIRNDYIKKPDNYIYIKDLIKKMNIPMYRYKMIDASKEANIKLELSSHLCKTHFPFYYTNHLFEDSLVTTMTFSKSENKTYQFSMQGIPEKQMYQMIDGSETIKLTQRPFSIKIRNYSKISFIMSGHISQDPPQLIIEDDKEIVRVGIMFFKNFPASGKLLGCTLLGMLLGCILYLCISRQKNKKKKTDEDKDEDKDKEMNGSISTTEVIIK